MKLFIAGATGAIGRQVVPRLGAPHDTLVRPRDRMDDWSPLPGRQALHPLASDPTQPLNRTQSRFAVLPPAGRQSRVAPAAAAVTERGEGSAATLTAVAGGASTPAVQQEGATQTRPRAPERLPRRCD